MLFSKPISDLRVEDIKDFCSRFHENLRVEYKSSFDKSVKSKLSKTLSSFANAYGGILIIGINAPGGVPQEPYEGIDFLDREPGLTVQNICREGIFPEIPIYTRFVSSGADGKGFLIVQVNESPKAPHAIENSTKVYVRTEGGTERTVLADIARVERMLFRRVDVTRRWDDFFVESETLANAAKINLRDAYREIRIGPLYPSEILMTREAVYDFLNDATRQASADFGLGRILRSLSGALLLRVESAQRFLNLGELGTMHYVESCYQPNYGGEGNRFLDFWSTAVSIRRILGLMGSLVEGMNVSCELRVDAFLRNISGMEFLSHTNTLRASPITTVGSYVQASRRVSSECLQQSALEITGDLMYQLRWPFGKERAPTLDEVRLVIEPMVRKV